MKTEAAAHYRVSVEEVPDELVASVTRSATFETVGTVVQEAFTTLGSAVGAAAAFGENAPGLITLELRDEEMTLEIFMSISHTFDPPPGVSVRTLEGGSFATTVHEGPYDGVGEAYQALTAWIADQRHVSTRPPRERYLNDPHTGEVPRTRVEFPIA